MIVKATILGYTSLHLFFSICDNCLKNKAYWTPYYLVDGLCGGGVMLWLIATLYCKKCCPKYKTASFVTMLYSIYMLVWNIVVPVFGYDRSGTKLSFFLSLFLIVVIYYVMFVPNGRFTKFLDEHLKAFNI